MIYRWSGKTKRHWCCQFTLSNGQMCQTHSKIYINGCCRLCSPLGQAICFFSNSEFQNVEFFKNSWEGISIRIPGPCAFAIQKKSWYLSKDEKSLKWFKISCWKKMAVEIFKNSLIGIQSGKLDGFSFLSLSKNFYLSLNVQYHSNNLFTWKSC